MAAINGARVVMGGLLAGLLLNVGDFIVNGVLLAGEFRDQLVRLGLDPAALESPSIAMQWVAVDFVIGLLMVWTYAAMRPRFGPGPRTAVLAFVPVLASITAIMFGLTAEGFFTASLFVKTTAFSALNGVIASMAGAWAYKE